MKQLFDIKAATAGDEQKILSIRIGEKHYSFAITNKPATVIYQLAYITIDSWNENEWNSIIESYPELNSSFYEVLIAYDFAESCLVPFTAIQKDDPVALLNSMFGINGQWSVITEKVNGWQLHTIYAIPTEIKNWVEIKFPSARYWHQYSVGIRNIGAATTTGTLLVDLRKNEFVVIAAINNKILLAQTYPYTTSEDILYYLIKICNQFSLSREEVHLQIAGLMDKQSAMYKELYQYFINLDFRVANWDTDAEFPAHFFTSLKDLAQCVS